MKRKTFLALGGIGASAVMLPFLGFTSSGFVHKAVSSIIHKHLDYLQFEPGLVEKFSADFDRYIKEYSFVNEQKTRLNLGRNYIFGGSSKTGIGEFVLERFLLSTDFFFNKMDESKPLKYMGFHGIVPRNCMNPFTNVYYPAPSEPAA